MAVLGIKSRRLECALNVLLVRVRSAEIELRWVSEITPSVSGLGAQLLILSQVVVVLSNPS